MKAIVNAKFILEDKILEDKILLFDEKLFGFVNAVPSNVSETIDAQGAYVSAGFIDIHIHGSGGSDVMDATQEALNTISMSVLQSGTTSFLPTTMTMSTEVINSALKNIQEYGKKVEGATVLGVHLEGPFISVEKHGAQDKTYVQEPNMALIRPYLDEIKMITLAPELEGAKAFIEEVKHIKPAMVLSIGHSGANYEKSKESFKWGISHATHIFNAMDPYHHRKPGVLGAVFDSEEVTCDIIADLVHTEPSTLKLAYKIKKEKLLLITDAIRAGCMKCGTYDLGGREVCVENGKATLDDGTLAGSVLAMNTAIRNMKKHTEMTLTEVIASVTSAPAKMLGIQKGLLKEKYDADIAIFDEDFSIIRTIVAGDVKYKRE